MKGESYAGAPDVGLEAGGTEGIARTVGDTLRAQGLEVDLLPPRDASR